MAEQSVNDIEYVMNFLKPHIRYLGQVRVLLGLESETDFIFETDAEEAAFYERENTIRLLTDKVNEQSKRIEMLEKLLAGTVPKKAQRAMSLKEALNDGGRITRRQAQTILGNVHHKLALEAMQEAAVQFDHIICIKNESGEWVLAVEI